MKKKSKEDMILDIVSSAGKQVRDHYLRKLIARKSQSQIERIYECMCKGEIGARFAYSVLTAGVYE